jgi:transposase
MATADEVAATGGTSKVAAFNRRKPFPADVPRERRIAPARTACGCCGGSRLAKLGDGFTESLEVIRRQLSVIQHIREKSGRHDVV